MAVRFYMTIAMVLCGLGSPARANTPSVPAATPWTLEHFQHRAFTVNDGLPSDGTTLMAQTADGLIWLAVPDGLMTFDGSHFRHFEPLPGERFASPDFNAMFAPASGGLWLRYQTKGEAFIRDGHITNFAVARDEGEHQAGYFFQDRNGDAWLAKVDGHLYRFDGTRWVKGPGQGAPEKIRNVTTDRHFNIWVVSETTGTVYRKLEGKDTFVDMGVRVPKGFSISVPTDNAVFVASLSRGMFRFRLRGDTLLACGEPLPGLGYSLLADGHGGGWMATVTDGLHYFPSVDALCPVPPEQGSNVALLSNKATGASGDLAMNALVDREGNIWSTSEGGLDRLTRSAFSRVKFPKSINMATIAADDDGSIWVGSESADLLHYADGVAAGIGVAPSALAVTHTRSNGVLAASTTGIWSVSGTPRLVAPLPKVQEVGYPRAVYQQSAAEGGAIWLALGPAVYLYQDHAWTQVPGVTRVRAIYGGGNGTVWLAARGENALVSHTASGLKTWGHQDGLDIGEVKVVTEDSGGTWVGGERGVQMLAGGRFRRPSFIGVAAPTQVTGMVFDHYRSLWIHAINGLYRVRAADVAAFVASRAGAVHADVFGPNDGLTGLASQQHSLPSLVKGKDGRLWVQGGNTVSWLDPRDLPERPVPARPIILGLSVGPQLFGPGKATVKLSRNQRNPVFSYTAPATTDATRVRFQTRLTGFDDTWVDQASHREAGYTKIGAGDYVFAVRASTDGVTWTASPPQLAISVAPFFFETRWFKAMCAAATLVLLWLLVRWQTRRALRLYRSRTQIRLEEREAIARDLHDTLLQSNVALVLQLEAIYQKSPEGETRSRIACLARAASAAVTEARIRVTALRERGDDNDALCVRLRDFGAQLASQSMTRFRFAVEGESLPLASPAGDEVRLLVSEAMTNAFRHAHATEVSLTVSFGAWYLRVVVKDDGTGMREPAPVAATLDGHWGIAGMRERANIIHARLVIRKGLPKGTEVRLVVPARRIYTALGARRAA